MGKSLPCVDLEIFGRTPSVPVRWQFPEFSEGAPGQLLLQPEEEHNAQSTPTFLLR